MIGLTGSSDEIRNVARAYRVYYMKTAEEDSDYLVDHSIVMYVSLFMLLLPKRVTYKSMYPLLTLFIIFLCPKFDVFSLLIKSLELNSSGLNSFAILNLFYFHLPGRNDSDFLTISFIFYKHLISPLQFIDVFCVMFSSLQFLFFCLFSHVISSQIRGGHNPN